MPLFPPKPKIVEISVTAEEAATIYNFLKNIDPTTIFTNHKIEIKKTEFVLSQIQKVSEKVNDALFDESIKNKTEFISKIKKNLNVIIPVDNYINDYMTYVVEKESPTLSEFKKAIIPNDK